MADIKERIRRWAPLDRHKVDPVTRSVITNRESILGDILTDIAKMIESLEQVTTQLKFKGDHVSIDSDGYRPCEFPRDWGKEVEFKDTCDVDWTPGVLTGRAEMFQCRNGNYECARIKVTNNEY